MTADDGSWFVCIQLSPPPRFIARISQEIIASQHVQMGESHNQHLSRQVMKTEINSKTDEDKDKISSEQLY